MSEPRWKIPDSACARCKARSADELRFFGSQPKCAFEYDGRFLRNNWACETMAELRRISDEIGTYTRDDMECASIGYVPYVDQDGEDSNGYIVMTWYKDRGKTGSALVMSDDEPVRELTEKMAVKAIEWHRSVHGGVR